MFDDIRTTRIDSQGFLAVVVFVALIFLAAVTLLEDGFYTVWDWRILVVTLLLFEVAAILAWFCLQRLRRRWDSRLQRDPGGGSLELDQTPPTEITPDLKSHPGIFIGKTTVGGDLPGLVMVMFFAFAAIYFFTPKGEAGVLLPLFLLVSIAAAIAYVLAERRDRKRAAQALAQLHSLGSEIPNGRNMTVQSGKGTGEMSDDADRARE